MIDKTVRQVSVQPLQSLSQQAEHLIYFELDRNSECVLPAHLISTVKRTIVRSISYSSSSYVSAVCFPSEEMMYSITI